MNLTNHGAIGGRPREALVPCPRQVMPAPPLEDIRARASAGAFIMGMGTGTASI